MVTGFPSNRSLSSQFPWQRGVAMLCLLMMALGNASVQAPAQAQTDGGAITLRADVQEANSNTGIVTARGNVRIDYPARQIHATSAQAQYYSRERRIVLNGNVFVQQEGNTLRAETVTYLIDEGRFVATPDANSQVESTYILPESPPATSVTAAPDELPPLPATDDDSVPADLP
jgi:lipopolysaccharide export system protein LptA